MNYDMLNSLTSWTHRLFGTQLKQDNVDNLISTGRSSTRYPSTFEEDLFLIGNLAEQYDEMLDFEDCDRIYRLLNKHVTLILEVELHNNNKRRLSILKQLMNSNDTQSIFSIHYPEEYRNLIVQALQRQDEVLEEMQNKLSHVVSAEIYNQSILFYSQMPEFQDRMRQSKFKIDEVLKLERNLNLEK